MAVFIVLVILQYEISEICSSIAKLLSFKPTSYNYIVNESMVALISFLFLARAHWGIFSIAIRWYPVSLVSIIMCVGQIGAGYNLSV